MSGQDKPRILLVEDETAIREGICDVLAYHGFAPSAAATGDEGLERALAGEFPLVILDVMLPGLSGLDICRRLRSEIPDQLILMLTAKGSEDDIVAGFRAGADDYVTKPFSVRELVARVEALLRRSGRLENAPDVFAFGKWRIDRSRLTAQRGGEQHELTQREVEILALFEREKGRIVSRRLLLQEVWNMANAEDVETRTVDMHIAKLRKKMGSDSESPIETVRGAGYRFTG
jgi:DNA-binding response OmpR family regulator